MRAYPIWNKVTACIYKSNKSYGVQDDGNCEVFCGSSSGNSHKLGAIKTKRIIQEHFVIFRLKVNGILISEKLFTKGANDVAKDLVYSKALTMAGAGNYDYDFCEDKDLLNYYLTNSDDVDAKFKNYKKP